MPTRIAAAVCTYDRYDLLPQTISSLLGQNFSGDLRVVVIDNSPDSPRARGFARRYDGIANLSYLVEETAGLSHARNVALAACDAELIAFIDDDAVAAPTWIEHIVAAFDAMGSDASVVGGKVVARWLAPRPSWLHDRDLGYLSLVDWGGALREAGTNEWLAGTNVAFRSAALRAAGGFSTRLGRVGPASHLLSNEELDVVNRIRARGGRVVYEPAAGVEHMIASQRLSRSWFRKRVAWQAVSDAVADPEAMRARLERARPELVRALDSLPAGERSWRGLAVDVDDAERFSIQLRAIYLIAATMLAGFEPDLP